MAALALAVAAVNGEPDRRRFRISLAISLSLTAVGQIVADVPDIFHRTFGPLGAASDICYVVGPCLEWRR